MKIFKQWWWSSTGKHLHRITWEGIKNLWKWFPLVWKDRDYDHSYIFDALRFKIQNTADYIETHKRYEGWERDVEKMRTCLRLIDKCVEEEYQYEYQEYYSNGSFGEVAFNMLDDYFAKYPNDYRRLPQKYKEYENKASTALMMAGLRQARATELLFKLIGNNIYNWWD